ncbi:MAG: metallophosphoesterase [Lentisphaeraceae bacterium]|nr:metallophosphoesterase [Lentisphaeraceae bacterium]
MNLKRILVGLTMLGMALVGFANDTSPSQPTRNTFMVLGNPYVEFPEEAKKSIMGSIEQAVEDADIDFVIIVGELTINATTEQFQAVKYIMENSPVPVYVTAGNHDLAYDNGDWQTGIPDDYAYFTEMLDTEAEYSFSKGRSYFIMQSHDDDVGYDFTNNILAELEDDTSYDFVYQVTESPLRNGIDLAVKPLIGITGGNKNGNKCQLVSGRHPRFVPIEHKYTEDEVDYLIVKENDGYILLDSYLDRTLDTTWKVTIDRSAGTSSIASYTYPVDFDVNGVSSSWLTSYGLGLTETATLTDTDRDGLTNLEEYLAGKNPLVNDSSPEIRVTEYYLTDGDFSGTTATLRLNQRIADDYFIFVRGSRTGHGLSYPDNNYARITGVPTGVGEMAGSGGWYNITLTRAAADSDWEGVVTVVECQNSLSAAGFNLVDILKTSLTGTSGTDTSEAWNDLDQVVLFGGYRGGGVSFSGETVSSLNQGTSAYTRLYPSGTNTLNWSRDAAGETLVDVDITTFVVEWGHEWNVQHVNVTGSNGGNGADVTGEYTTAPINNVSRANSWVWGTGTRTDAGIGDCAESCLVTLGDGVNQNSTENSVAVGSEYTDAYDFDVYVLTHPSISIDHLYVEDGNQKVLDLPVKVSAATTGTRFAWAYNGLNGIGRWHPCSLFWARYTGDSEITLSRGFEGQTFPAWVQGIDFSGLNNKK